MKTIQRYAGTAIDWIIKVAQASSSAILLVEGMCTLTRWAQHRLTGIPYMAP